MKNVKYGYAHFLSSLLISQIRSARRPSGAPFTFAFLAYTVSLFFLAFEKFHQFSLNCFHEKNIVTYAAVACQHHHAQFPFCSVVLAHSQFFSIVFLPFFLARMRGGFIHFFITFHFRISFDIHPSAAFDWIKSHLRRSNLCIMLFVFYSVYLGFAFLRNNWNKCINWVKQSWLLT